MKRSLQNDFFAKDREYGPRRYTHGGDGSQKRRKIQRPLDTRKPIHIVMKASVAKEKLSLLGPKNQLKVKKILDERARQFRVKLHGFENMGNHLHIVASFKRREDFQNFLRTISALIARAATGARKGKAFGKRFWDRLAFTRVLVGLRGYRVVQSYMKKNEIEREFGYMARLTVDEYQRAEAKAKKLRCDVWKILESSGSVY